ncbi:helix-turn-helix domain-containing protein [Bacillus pseudomycoides]|nr:helix-turn-helix transcriptional regulator [Bacillus pseudomycoides]
MDKQYKEIGSILRLRRKNKGLTLEVVAEFVGVSINYISELERGKGKVPSDSVLQRLAMVLSLDEQEVFKGYGKLPVSIVQELESNDMLLRTLYDIKNNPELTDADRNNLYDEIHKLYLKHLRK